VSAAAFEPYTRCPGCGFIAQPSSMDYMLGDRGGTDWTRSVRVSCTCCHHRYLIGRDDVLPLTAEQSCPRCTGTVTACAAGAGRVRCTGCGVYLIGSGLSDAQRDELRITEGMASLALRESYLAALQRVRGARQ
jgi:hypothetical protein